MEISKLSIKSKLPLANNLSIDSQRSNYSEKTKKDKTNKMKKEQSMKDKLLRSLTNVGQNQKLQATIEKEKMAQKKLFYQELENSLIKTEDYVNDISNQVQAPYHVNFSDMALDPGAANLSHELVANEAEQQPQEGSTNQSIKDACGSKGIANATALYDLKEAVMRKEQKLKAETNTITENYDAPLIDEEVDCCKLLVSVVKSILYSLMIGFLIFFLVNFIADPSKVTGILAGGSDEDLAKVHPKIAKALEKADGNN